MSAFFSFYFYLYLIHVFRRLDVHLEHTITSERILWVDSEGAEIETLTTLEEQVPHGTIDAAHGEIVAVYPYGLAGNVYRNLFIAIEPDIIQQLFGIAEDASRAGFLRYCFLSECSPHTVRTSVCR